MLGFSRIYYIIFKKINYNNKKKAMKKTDRPQCGCGQTNDPNGCCDGSHLK
jgi:hypothetical protein